MKGKVFIFVLLILFLLTLSGNNLLTHQVLAQETNLSKNVPHTVLVELFVQIDCPLCPTAEFCLEDLAWEYGTTKVILIEEHLWGDGYDTQETNARYNWYVGDGRKGTPDVYIDGLTKRLQGRACDCAEANYECYKDAIDEELGRSSLLELSAFKTIIGDNYIIEGTVKNISDTPLKNLAVCGMAGKEKYESGLYNYIQDIFPFQNMSTLLPQGTSNFKFVTEIPLAPESQTDDEKEILHLVIFVQNTETKEILQSFYIE